MTSSLLLACRVDRPLATEFINIQQVWAHQKLQLLRSGSGHQFPTGIGTARHSDRLASLLCSLIPPIPYSLLGLVSSSSNEKTIHMLGGNDDQSDQHLHRTSLTRLVLLLANRAKGHFSPM